MRRADDVGPIAAGRSWIRSVVLVGVVVQLLLLVSAARSTTATTTSCGLAELSCKQGHCVPVDAYCNGVDDCGDGSDEPPLCTPCNRTYHGREGRTYRLELARPGEGRLPFLCHLTFTAAGSQGHGELVQLLWDAFSIGRLVVDGGVDGSGSNDQQQQHSSTRGEKSSCPEGSMQLAELGRPFTGGSWCGPGEALRATYYSETSTVTASIRLFEAPASVPFEFRLRYRFVSRSEAVARLGSPEAPLERGSPVPGTYCSRNFHECYQRSCRVQSPNYPGEYPRNASCLIVLRQKEVPTCKHAMMSVRTSRTSSPPPPPTSSSSSSSSQQQPQNVSVLSVWQDCPEDRDRLVLHDGSRLEDPILLVYCGGPLPRITARGPSMLVHFVSSPVAIPLGASALRFELETQVIYVDSDGLDYAPTAQGCYFFINGSTAAAASSKRSGVLRAPLHALPPGTNCTWSLKGSLGDRIWFYFASYSQRDLLRGGFASAADRYGNATLQIADAEKDKASAATTATKECSIKLTFWDGAPSTGLPLAVLCDESPRLCAHAALRNSTRSQIRPCQLPDESYLTQTPSLTIRMESLSGTALNTVNFNARYEFVGTLQGGEQWVEGAPCSRLWRRVKSGQLASPRDLRLYGRGGARRLDCRYRIEAAAGERVKLTVHNVSLGEATACSSEPDPHSGRPRCVHEPGSREARLSLFEAPWKDVRLPRACLCSSLLQQQEGNASISSSSNSNNNLLPLSHLTSGRALELHFYVDRMSPDEDFDSLFFNASFEIVRAPECPRKQRVRGEGGELRFVSPPLSRPDIYCEGLPWLVEARENRSLFVLTWGWLLPLEPPPLQHDVEGKSEVVKCPTTNRLLLYSGWPPRLHKVVCPAEPGSREYTVHVFSEEWLGAASAAAADETVSPLQQHQHQQGRSAVLLLDFVAREPGQAAASWLEISKSRAALRSQLRLLPERDVAENGSLTRDCPHKCPELGACIAATLWCDGYPHCPSGHDEADCGAGTRLLGLLPSAIWLLIAAAAGVLAAAACIFAILMSRSKARAKRLQYEGSTLSSTCSNTNTTRKQQPPRRTATEESLISRRRGTSTAAS